MCLEFHCALHLDNLIRLSLQVLGISLHVVGISLQMFGISLHVLGISLQVLGIAVHVLEISLQVLGISLHMVEIFLCVFLEFRCTRLEFMSHVPIISLHVLRIYIARA